MIDSVKEVAAKIHSHYQAMRGIYSAEQIGHIINTILLLEERIPKSIVENAWGEFFENSKKSLR